MLFYRARLVNYIKTSEVIRQPYPLQIRASGAHSYFMKRETWGWTDFLMNPMVKTLIHAGYMIVLCSYTAAAERGSMCLKKSATVQLSGVLGPGNAWIFKSSKNDNPLYLQMINLIGP